MSAYLCDDAHFATLAVAYAEITGMPQDFAQNLATGRGATRAPDVWSIDARTPEPEPEPAPVPMADQIARLRAEHPQLETPTRERDALVTAARNIRAQLRARWPDVKFSVRTSRYSGGNSIDVSWIDGPTDDQVSAIANRYQAGHFDGMTDCYEYASSAWTDAFGAARFVFTRREYSDQAIAWAKAQYGEEERFRCPAYLEALRDLSIKRIKRSA